MGTFATLALSDANGSPLFPASTTNFAGGTGAIGGFRWVESTNVSTTLPAGTGTQTKLYCGAFGKFALLGTRKAMSVLVNPYRYDAENATIFTFTMRAAFKVAKASAFGELIAIPTT
jgi:HK97 family phage major capsid protein